MKPLRAFPTLATTVAAFAAIAGPASAANPEIISRLDGASGAPFPAGIAAFSNDGRFVVLQPKSPSAAAQLGVAQPADPAKVYLRDRATDSTTELALRATPGGPIAEASALDISNDGQRVLFGTGDPLVTGAAGLPPAAPGVQGYLVVADRAGGNLWVVRDATGAPVRESFALLSADGRSALVMGQTPEDPEFALPSIQRAHVDRSTEVVVRDNDGGPYFRAATDDLSVVLYQRSLKASQRPQYAERSQAGTTGVGLATPQGNRIIVQGKAVESVVNPGGQCSSSNVRIRSVDPQPLALSADGQRVSYSMATSSISQSPGDEGKIEGYSTVVAGPGGVKRTTSTTTSELANQVWPRTLAATHDVFAESSIKPLNWQAPTLDDYGTGYTLRSASAPSFTQSGGGLQNLPVTFADGDRTVIWSSQTQVPFEGQTPPASLPYVYAEPVTGTLPPSGTGASLWSQGVPDTPDLTSDVTWADCEDTGGDAPVAPVDKYVGINLRSPVISSASAGTVNVDMSPAGYRRATRVVLEYKLLGFSYWRKTVTAGDTYVLPRPPLWLPLTLTATVSPEAVEGQPAPKPLTLSRGVFAAR